jgi:hypothetical protein
MYFLNNFFNEFKLKHCLFKRPGSLDPSRFDFNELRKFLVTNIQVLCKDPHTQIHGVIILVDYTRLSLTHALHMTPQRARKLGQMIQVLFLFQSLISTNLASTMISRELFQYELKKYIFIIIQKYFTPFIRLLSYFLARKYRIEYVL